jgi:predicted protein tyrosine phosphatase
VEKRKWKCETCDNNAIVSWEDIEEIGTPFCSDCDNNMVLDKQMRIIVSKREKISSDINSINDLTQVRVISITDPGSTKIELPISEHRVIRKQFHDLEDNYPGKEPHILLFNNTIAKEIVDFLEIINGDTVIVHCEAGISRSPAIAAAIALKYVSEEVCQTFFKRYLPNRTVFRIMCEEFKIEQPKVLHSHEINSNSFFNFFDNDDEVDYYAY